MTKVRVVIYRMKHIIGGFYRTTKEIIEGDLTDAEIEALKRLLKGGRK